MRNRLRTFVIIMATTVIF